MGTFLTNNGRAYITALLIAQTTYVAWGTGGTAAAATSTAVSTESSDESRVATTNTQRTTTVTNDCIRYAGTITCAVAGKTITNAGILNAASSGTLIAITDGVATTVAVGDAILFQFDMTF